MVDARSLQIIATAHGKGREHDFKLFKRSHCPCRVGLELLGDGGYQGVKKLVENSRTPHKRWRGRALTVEQRAENKSLASERVVVENVIRRLKVFRVLKETYRHRRRRFGLRLNLIAGLYNADLQVKS
jgi:DDE superfamily endonuclease